MKRVALLLVVFCLAGLVVADEVISDREIVDAAKEAGSRALEGAGEVGRNVNVYAEILGENLLKFQSFFVGALKFVSLGFFDVSDEMSFARFLFAALLFMAVYTIVGFMFSKLNFWISFLISFIAFVGIGDEALEGIFFNYEAMGIVITVVLPILILLAFTYRIYDKAYNAKSSVSPFYAEMFNLVFLVFFGIFFIRHSKTEEGAIALLRFVSGILLILMGIGQTVFYKMFASWVEEGEREKRDRKRMKREAVEKIKDMEAEQLFGVGDKGQKLIGYDREEVPEAEWSSQKLIGHDGGDNLLLEDKGWRSSKNRKKEEKEKRSEVIKKFRTGNKGDAGDPRSGWKATEEANTKKARRLSKYGR